MRSFVGFAMLVAAGLGGIEYATQNMPSLMPGSGQQMQAAIVESSSLATPSTNALLMQPAPSPTFGGMIQTVAANESPSLPPVKVAPEAPRATPIEPIVTPMKRAAPKPVATKSPSGKAALPAKSAKPAVKSPATKTAAKPATKSKTTTVHSAKAAKLPPGAAGVTVTRPGFKLTCTSVQKLDPVKQRCVPLKTASSKKPKI